MLDQFIFSIHLVTDFAPETKKNMLNLTKTNIHLPATLIYKGRNSLLIFAQKRALLQRAMYSPKHHSDTKALLSKATTTQTQHLGEHCFS